LQLPKDARNTKIGAIHIWDENIFLGILRLIFNGFELVLNVPTGWGISKLTWIYKQEKMS
jgi:hypothetical protein